MPGDGGAINRGSTPELLVEENNPVDDHGAEYEGEVVHRIEEDLLGQLLLIFRVPRQNIRLVEEDAAEDERTDEIDRPHDTERKEEERRDHQHDGIEEDVLARFLIAIHGGEH